jgi:hypothetical protein
MRFLSLGHYADTPGTKFARWSFRS